MEVKNAVLVSLNISMWQANRQDKDVASKVTDENEVKDPRLGRFWKSLLPKCDAVTKLQAVVRAARTFHYDNTLTWMHDGPRVLPTANYEPYMREMRKLKDDFEAALVELIRLYPSIVEDAELALGKLFNKDDYPSAGALRHKYDFTMKVMALPDSQAVTMLGLKDEEAETLKASYESDLKETYANANRRNYEDMHERLEKLVAQLKDGDAQVRDGTINAVRDLADLLPRLNLTNDKNLDALSTRLKESLGDITATTVKNDPSARQRVAKETQTVFNVMQAFMAPHRAAVSPSAQEGGLKRAA
jgi:soluble cytochrome b562